MIDSTTAFEVSKDARLLNVTFDVLKSARGGDTSIEFENGVISNGEAMPLAVVFRSGKISIVGLVSVDSGASVGSYHLFPSRMFRVFDLMPRVTFVGQE